MEGRPVYWGHRSALLSAETAHGIQGRRRTAKDINQQCPQGPDNGTSGHSQQACDMRCRARDPGTSPLSQRISPGSEAGRALRALWAGWGGTNKGSRR